MKSITKPIKPSLDLNNTIESGLVFAAEIYEGSGLTMLDIAGQVSGVLSSGISWAYNSSIGLGVNFTSSSSKKGAFTTIASQNSLVNQTVEIIFKSPSSYTDGETLFNKGQEGVSASGRYLMIGEYSSGLNAQTIVSAHASQNGVWTYANPSVSTVHHLIITYNNAAGNAPVVWLDGVSVGVSTVLSATGAVNADTSDLTIGNKYSGNNSYKDEIYLVREFNRILTSTEIGLLNQNPWRICLQGNMPNLGLLRPRPFAPGIAR